MPISSYTYTDDIKVFRDNATLGVNKMDYLIASGIEQKHISDVLALEKILGLDQITPMQTSYTQTAEDRTKESDGADIQKNASESGIEPSETEQQSVSDKQTAED